jgi:hypothetical protein
MFSQILTLLGGSPQKATYSSRQLGHDINQMRQVPTLVEAGRPWSAYSVARVAYTLYIYYINILYNNYCCFFILTGDVFLHG